MGARGCAGPVCAGEAPEVKFSGGSADTKRTGAIAEALYWRECHIVTAELRSLPSPQTR